MQYRVLTRCKIAGISYRRGDYISLDPESARLLVRGNVLMKAKDQAGAEKLVKPEKAEKKKAEK